MGTHEQIPPGERRELRAVVRSQIKVLRAEVGQREMELQAEVESRLAERYRDEDAKADEFSRSMRDITRKANDEIEKVLDPLKAITIGKAGKPDLLRQRVEFRKAGSREGNRLGDS